ncbi:peroxisome assembly protein (Peroxin-2) [Dispira parvispora]|uniref:RING-type E3 ubiquitin transferase (cysteine targeting) n=1 Tax=Dispira parvispora TaxID=1520584 RepID=A0A9W8AWI1_9FUNG|nr:peroxisome assembly protein (Peroxin-2) [Dispira parvispora]
MSNPVEVGNPEDNLQGTTHAELNTNLPSLSDQGLAAIQPSEPFWDPLTRAMEPDVQAWRDRLQARVPSPATRPPWVSNWLQFCLTPHPKPAGGDYHVSRVSQLDSDLLDTELITNLWERWQEGIKYFRSSLTDKLQPEITALLQLVVYYLTVGGPQNATYGAQLQNLKYRNEFKHARNPQRVTHAPLSRFQVAAYGILLVGGRYSWTRLNQWLTTQGWSEAPRRSWRKRIWHLVQKLDAWYHVLALVNFLVFIYAGRYKSVLTRLLGMRMVYARSQMYHGVSYEYMNRQMVWYGFTEFLLFVLPLINIRRIRQSISSGAQMMMRPWQNTRLGQWLGVTHGNRTSVGNKDTTPPYICLICVQGGPGANQIQQLTTGALPGEPAGATGSHQPKSYRVRVPYVTNCGHFYCYVCISTQMALDGDHHNCLRCGKPVLTIQRLPTDHWQELVSVEKNGS